MKEDVIQHIVESSKDTDLEKRMEFTIALILDDYMASIETGKENKHRLRLKDIISQQRKAFIDKLKMEIVEGVMEWELDGRPKLETDVMGLCRFMSQKYKEKSCVLRYRYIDFDLNEKYGDLNIENNKIDNIIENSKTLRDIMSRPGFKDFII